MMQCKKMLLFFMACSIGYAVHAANNDGLFEKFIIDNSLDFIKRKPMVSGDKIIAPHDAGNLKRALFELMKCERYSQNDRSDIIVRLVKKVNLHADIPQKSLRQVKKTSHTFLQSFFENACYSINIFNELKRLGFLEGFERENGYILDALKLIFNVGVKPKAQDLIYAIERMKGMPPPSSNPFDIMIKHASFQDLKKIQQWLNNPKSQISIKLNWDALKKSVKQQVISKGSLKGLILDAIKAHKIDAQKLPSALTRPHR